jgi:hypothetical protein
MVPLKMVVSLQIIPITPPKWHLLKVTESGYDQHSELWKIHDQWRLMLLGKSSVSMGHMFHSYVK